MEARTFNTKWGPMISNNAKYGAEAWRALATRWAPRNLQRAWELKKRCHAIGKASNYNDLAVKIETIKSHIKEYGECAGEELKDEDQKMIITMEDTWRTPGGHPEDIWRTSWRTSGGGRGGNPPRKDGDGGGHRPHPFGHAQALPSPLPG